MVSIVIIFKNYTDYYDLILPVGGYCLSCY